MAVLQAEAQADDLALALGQAVEHLRQLLLQHAERGGVGRHHGGVVLDEVAQLGVLLLADGRLERHGLLRDLLDLAHALGGQAHLLADLLGAGLAAELLEQLALDAHELVDGLHHVHGDADGAGLVGDGARDGLADPPGGVRRELEALRVVELLHRADEAEVALLDEVEEQHAAAHVALGDGHDEAQVRLDELLLGVDAHLLDAAEAALLAALELDALVLGAVQLLGGRHAGLYLHGQVDLLRGGEQRNLADLLQVHAHGVAREHGHAGVGAAFARRAGLALRHLRQLHLDGCLELLLGNALEQVLVLVKAGFQLVVVQRIGSADVGLHVQRVVIVQYLFGIDRGFRTLLGVGLDSLVLRGLGHVIFLSNWMRSGMRKHARRAQRYSGAVYHRSSAFAAYFSHAFPIRQSPPGAVRQSSATCYSSGGMKERSVS